MSKGMEILQNELFEAFANASEFVYIYVCDMKTDMSRWSPNSVRYFDLPGEYMEGAGEIWGSRIHPDDKDIYWEDISAVFSGKNDRHNCQYRAKNCYGDYVWLECKGSVICDDNGEPAVFAGLMTRLDNQNKYDALTNLLTTYEFYKCDFEGSQGAMILLGIDDFRKLLSSHGYSFGNEVLVEFARGLGELCKDDKRLYRFSGDEFLFVLPGMGESGAKDFFAKILWVAEHMEPIKDQNIRLSVSAGAVFYPADGTLKEQLVNNLEHSLEYAKTNYKGDMVFFSRKILEKHNRIQLLKEDLKNSIENDFEGFELYFQPLVEPEGRRVSGCEALLRWKGEKIMDSYPTEFIKALEYNGDIRKVGKWVMEQALRQQKEWQEIYGDIKVSFNVSYQQFMDESFVDGLIRKAEELGVSPSSMIVELTESREVEQTEDLAAIFHKLKKQGFQIALDDFGTGYASLEMIKKLPVNYIKIEHSFVRELAEPGHEIDFIIIRQLLELGRHLNCNTIVEGVENQKVDKIVGAMEATYLQGYFYARPLCKKDFEAMLESGRSYINF